VRKISSFRGETKLFGDTRYVFRIA
jgi:hypothetical protein